MPSPPRTDRAVIERIATLLLITTVLLALAAAWAGWGWWRASQRSISAADLDAGERQRLVQEMVDQSPGVFRWTFFAPRIGYSLRPEAEIDLFDDVFRSNALGMRSGPVEKAPGSFRILFVGDSWAYGMGVREDQAFPRLVADLANASAGVGQVVESTTLALPGWNAVNQVAALETYVDLLQPDAVIFAPTSNDHHSTGRVLPNGSIWWGGVLPDFLGDRHSVTYPDPFVDTYRSRQRWLASFGEWRRAEARLAERGIPTAFFFVARWVEAFVHVAVHHSGLESRYMVVPRRYTMDAWANPPPYRHASPAGHRLYARSIYRLLAQPLGWQPLPADDRDAELRIVDEVPSGPALQRYERDVLALFAFVNGQVPTTFRPGPKGRRQTVGPIDLRSGLIGRSTTLLVRRPAGARAVEVVVQRLSEVGWLDPLQLEVRIPSPSGGTRATTTITGTGRPRRLVKVRIPDDLADDAVLDVVLETDAARATATPEIVRALKVVRITPVDRD